MTNGKYVENSGTWEYCNMETCNEEGDVEGINLGNIGKYHNKNFKHNSICSHDNSNNSFYSNYYHDYR